MDDQLGPSGEQVVVTGGAGFIGSRLAAFLGERNDVTVVDDLSGGNRENVPGNATFFECDIRNQDAIDSQLADVDVVFHLAGLTSVEESVAASLDCQERNAKGSLTIFEAARKHSCRVVFASSAAIYGSPSYTPIDETHPTEPASPYGIDKLAADQYARLYHRLYDLETAVLRYFNVYGPRQSSGSSGVVGIFANHARNGEDLPVQGNGLQTRDFVYVDDVVRANCLAATADATAMGRAYNIGTGEAVSIRSLAETITSISDSGCSIDHRPARDGDIDQSVADISRAKEALGYQPQVDLRSGLAELLSADT